MKGHWLCHLHPGIGKASFEQRAIATSWLGQDQRLVEIAKRALAPEAFNRFADAGEMAEAIADYQTAVQERLRKAELERVAAETKAAEETKRRRVAMGLAAAVILLLGTVAFAAMNYRRQGRGCGGQWWCRSGWRDRSN